MITILKSVRSHWVIESELHWVLDVEFREDDDRKTGNSGKEKSMVIGIKTSEKRENDNV